MAGYKSFMFESIYIHFVNGHGFATIRMSERAGTAIEKSMEGSREFLNFLTGKCCELVLAFGQIFFPVSVESGKWRIHRVYS